MSAQKAIETKTLHHESGLSAHMVYTYAVIQVSPRKWRVIGTSETEARGAMFYFFGEPMSMVDAMQLAAKLNKRDA